jgi:FHIPEP family/TIR domain
MRLPDGSASSVKVFLSYSSTDAALARRLALDLRAANVDVWLDQWALGVGEQFEQRIERGVDEAEFVIVLLTSASVASNWVDREWRRKVHDEARTERIAVVPVRGEACDMPDFLAQRSHADISGGSYPLGLRRLLEILSYYSGVADLSVPSAAIDPEAASPNLVPIVRPIVLEVSRDLIPAVAPDGAGRSRALDVLAPAVREQLWTELGLPVPGISVRGNETDMPPRSALVLIDEVPELMVEVDPDDIDDLFETLKAVLKRNAALFVDLDVARRLVGAVELEAPELVAATVPKALAWIDLTEVLQRLVDEEVAIGDMRRILQALAECGSGPRDPLVLVERVREALCATITARFARAPGVIPALSLAPDIEARLNAAIEHTAAGSYIHLDPGLATELLRSIRAELTALGQRAAGAVIVTIPEIRRYVRKLVELEFPALHVLSRRELDPGVVVEAVATIRVVGCARGESP